MSSSLLTNSLSNFCGPSSANSWPTSPWVRPYLEMLMPSMALGVKPSSAAARALADKTSPFSSKTQTALGSIPIKEISCSTPSGVLEFLEKNENSLLAMCFPRARVVAAPGGPCFLYANKFTAHLQGKTNAGPRGRLPPPLQRRAGSFYTRRKAGWKGLVPRRAE